MPRPVISQCTHPSQTLLLAHDLVSQRASSSRRQRSSSLARSGSMLAPQVPPTTVTVVKGTEPLVTCMHATCRCDLWWQGLMIKKEPPAAMGKPRVVVSRVFSGGLAESSGAAA